MGTAAESFWVTGSQSRRRHGNLIPNCVLFDLALPILAQPTASRVLALGWSSEIPTSNLG